ncbi:hypothetical protein SAMN05444003_2751 [Cognatiyoonia sediminum]|uniref:Uncharacterized protein n=1 Tax=Cognatiyoonia sediminum TaxID=1508389 RepID=A0A1M5RYZ0_9RHOB|nr:hypothetical protein [Cognatiyoonia sediminum]SHH31023.1 hypothetical protein SAMN05444003_2751 [Cognatiyoonia sediminum]
MIRLFRTLILILIAFVAGILFDDNGRQELCAAEGGDWRDRTCFLKE